MKKMIVATMLACLLLSGCANSPASASTPSSQPTAVNSSASASQDTATVQAVDFSDCFGGVNGSAIFYNSETKESKTYNDVEAQFSPCSTFKIIATLLGLENGILVNESSTMEYSGGTYFIDAWNQNVTLKEAFQTSCVWYFKQVIDKTGASTVQQTLTDLGYGNYDTSEWDGSGLNPTFDTNGFWLESSLKISPNEQVTVLSKIFEEKTSISQPSILLLKNIMQRSNEGSSSIYGKTGTGRSNGWFVGFFEQDAQRWYFAVHLQDENNATGKRAEEITRSIIGKYF